jgi:hypothetical protein
MPPLRTGNKIEDQDPSRKAGRLARGYDLPSGSVAEAGEVWVDAGRNGAKPCAHVSA